MSANDRTYGAVYVFCSSVLVWLAAATAQAETKTPPTKISGTVVSEDGRALAEAKVWFVPSKASQGTNTLAVTDKQGRFHFDPVPVDAYRLAVVAPGKSYGGITHYAGAGQPVLEHKVSLAVTAPEKLKVHVVDQNNAPVEGAEVQRLAWKSGNSNWFGLPLEALGNDFDRPRSDNNGVLTVQNLPSGTTVKVTVKHANFARHTVEVNVPTDTSLELVLRKGRPLVIEVVEAATGAAAKEATIDISRTGDDDMHDVPVDEHGRLTVRIAHARSLVVHARHPRLLAKEWLSLGDWDEDSDTPSAVRFELVVMARVKGRVVDEKGQPAAGVVVNLAGSRKVLARSRTDDSGHYDIEGPEGDAVLEVHDGGDYYAEAKQQVRVTLSPDSPVEAADLVAHRVPSLRGVVVLPDGGPAANALVVDESNFSANSAMTDDQGRFELPGDGGHRRGVVHVTACHLTEKLSGDATTDFDGLLRGDELRIELKPEAAIVGRIIDDAGKPLKGIRVDLQSWASNGRSSVGKIGASFYSDDGGNFHCVGLSRALSYRVLVRDESDFQVAKSNSVKLETDEIEVQLPAVSNTKDLVREAVAETAPELSCAGWVGPVRNIESLRGNVVLLDFWATWCGPCVKELPAVQRLHEVYADKGLVVIGLHHNSVSEEEVRQFTAEHRLTYPIGLDDEAGATCARYNVQAFPTKVLIARDGRLRSACLTGNLLVAVRREVLYGD
jgi:thiol-disulfide isomerase/thioredoxin